MRTFERLGGTQSIAADIRVIAATNRSLDELVKQGAFRQDLYYRINIVKIRLPPLRDRKEDVALLVEHFIDRFGRLKGKDIGGVSEEALSIVLGHDFPGNVRELENAIEHAFVLCRGGLIEPRHLPDQLCPATPEAAPASVASLSQMEAHLITQALERNNWNRLATAQELGIHKTTLWRKIKKLDIKPPDADGLAPSSQK